MKPILLRPDLRLVPVTSADVDRICTLLWDEHVRRYLCDGEILPREKIIAFIEVSLRLDPQGLGAWTIGTEAIGFAGIVALTPVAHEAATHPVMQGGIEPTIALDPGAWGTGLATRTLDCLAHHAGTACGLERLVANVDEPNTASHRMMTRCGYRETGRGQGRKYPLVFYERILTPERTMATPAGSVRP